MYEGDIMANKNYLMSGITELLILSILKEHDSYVYEIGKLIKAESKELLSISQNTIYTVTYKLENEHKISEYSKLVGRKRPRVYYHIEQEGIDYLDSLLETFHSTITGTQNVLAALKKNQGDEITDD